MGPDDAVLAVDGEVDVVLSIAELFGLREKLELIAAAHQALDVWGALKDIGRGIWR